jgi:hypothetical protein
VARVCIAEDEDEPAFFMVKKQIAISFSSHGITGANVAHMMMGDGK